MRWLLLTLLLVALPVQAQVSPTIVGFKGSHGIVATATAVTPSGLLLSAGHTALNFRPGDMVSVTFPNGADGRATLICRETGSDAAWWQLNQPGAVIHVPLSPFPPEPGEVIVFFGYPGGVLRSFAGTWTGRASPDYPNEVLIALDAPQSVTILRGGISGGPVLSRRTLVGIVTRGYFSDNSKQSYGWASAIPAHPLMEYGCART